MITPVVDEFQHNFWESMSALADLHNDLVNIDDNMYFVPDDISKCYMLIKSVAADVLLYASVEENDEFNMNIVAFWHALHELEAKVCKNASDLLSNLEEFGDEKSALRLLLINKIKELENIQSDMKKRIN